MRLGGASVGLARCCCLLAALLGQAPRCTDAFVPQAVGNVLGHQVKAALSSLSTLKAMGDVYENFESKATRDHDHYMASLKRPEAYPQEPPPSLSRNQQELLNEQAKARIEAYKRGEIPPPSPPVVPQSPAAQWSSPAAVPLPPPTAPAGPYPAYPAQPGAPNAPQPAYPAQPGVPNAPQGYYYPPPQPGPYPVQAPQGPYPSAPAVPAPPQPQQLQQQPQEPVRLSPSGQPYPPGFNPTFWQDFFRAQQENEAAEKAAKEGGEFEPQGADAKKSAAPAPAAATSIPPAPARQPPPPPAQPSPPSPQSASPARDDTPGGSRFRAVFEAQKSTGTGNTPRDRLKQWLLSKYPPEDQSEQAIQYRRYIEANDMGYTGQYGQDDAYLTQLKQDSKQRLKQQGYAPGGAQPPAGPPVGPQGPSPYGRPPAPGAPMPGAGAPYAAMPPAPPAAAYPGQGPPQLDPYGYPQTPYYPPPPAQRAPVDPYYGYYQPPPQGPAPYMGQPVPPPPPAIPAPPTFPQAIAPPAAPSAPRYVNPEPQPQSDPVGRATKAVEAPSEATPALESSIRELMGYLYKHRGGPGFGAGRLKSPQEIQRLETLLDDVKARLYAETGAQRDSAVDEGEKQVLLTAADGLRRLAAQGRKGGVQEVLTAVLKAVATVEGWRGAKLESAAAAPASGPLTTQSRPAAGQAEKAVVADQVEAPQVTKTEVAVAGGETQELSDELRRKLQGTMALSLKHSGALGRGTGPLQGEELDLLKSSLTEVSAALRKETEAAYGQSIEKYLRENDLGDAPVTTQSVQPSTAPAAAVPKPSKVAVSYKEQLALARQKKAERQKQ